MHHHRAPHAAMAHQKTHLAETLRATNGGDPELLTAADAAKRYSVSVSSIRAWLRRGWLPSVTFGRRCVRIPRRLADERLIGRSE